MTPAPIRRMHTNPNRLDSPQCPQVTVVVPCYNVERYVAATLESVLGQEGATFEIVAVDDGSTDSTPTILAGFGERIRVLTQANAGLGAARNAGAAKARGALFIFLDADDILLPGAMVRLCERIVSSGLGVAYGEAIAMDEKGEPISGEPMGYRSPDGNTMRALCAGTLFQPSAGMVRRDVFEKVGGFDESLDSVEDLDFQYRCAAHTEFVKISDPVIYYRINPTSMSRNYPRMVERSIKVHETNARRFGLWRSYPLQSLFGRLKAGFYFCSEHLNSHGRRSSEISANARRSMRRHPWLLLVLSTMPLLSWTKRAMRGARTRKPASV